MVNGLQNLDQHSTQKLGELQQITTPQNWLFKLDTWKVVKHENFEIQDFDFADFKNEIFDFAVFDFEDFNFEDLDFKDLENVDLELREFYFKLQILPVTSLENVH